MSRRRVAAASAVLLAASALGSGGTASAADEAATVNGESITLDEFEDAVEQSGAVDSATGTAGAAAARTTLSNMIADIGREQFLRAHGIEPQAGAVAEQLERLEAPETDSLAGFYNERPASLGLICARLMPVADEASGAAAVADLAGGASFSEAAREHSVDPTVPDYDGWITGNAESPCLALTDLQFDARLASTFVEADPGVPVGPVVFDRPPSPLIFVMEIAEFDEVADAIAAFYAGAEASGTSVGELLFRGWFLEADVTVNPRYGRWDQASASIIPLGQQ